MKNSKIKFINFWTKNLTFLLLFNFLFSSCWVFNGENPIHQNEISVNTKDIETTNETITQEVVTNVIWEFGNPQHQNQDITDKITTRRQYFGDVIISISANVNQRGSKILVWENYVNGQLKYRGEGGWLNTDLSDDRFEGVGVFKNIQLVNQVDNHIKIYLQTTDKKILLQNQKFRGEIVIFADYSFPTINLTFPTGVIFQNDESINTAWFTDQNGRMTGNIVENFELKNFSYRFLDNLSKKRHLTTDADYTEVELSNGNWEIAVELGEAILQIELKAEDIFGNKSYKIVKMGLDVEGPVIVFTNSAGVREKVLIEQGVQTWSADSRDAELLKFNSKSFENVNLSGRVMDISSGPQKIEVYTCHDSLNCLETANWKLADSLVAGKNQLLDFWNFTLITDKTNPDAHLKGGRNNIKITAYDTSQNKNDFYILFIIDQNPPTINSFDTVVSSDNDTIIQSTTSRFVTLKLHAIDNETIVEKYCIKLSPEEPSPTNNCWKSIINPVSEMTEFIDFELPFFPKLYTVFVWVSDEVGNISTQSYRSQSDATIENPNYDSSKIFFTPTEKPTLFEIFAANTTHLSYWPTVNEMQTSDDYNENKILIRWRVKNSEEISYVNLSYRLEDGSNYVENIALNVFHGMNLGCTLKNSEMEFDYFEGCYVWDGSNVPIPQSNTPFSIRLDVFNRDGQSDGANTNTFNRNDRRYSVFGNGKLGTNHLAVSDLFRISTYPNFSRDNLIVLSDGTIFVTDQFRGLLRIDPISGNSNIVIALDTQTEASFYGVSADDLNGWSVNSYKIEKIKIHQENESFYLYFKYLGVGEGSAKTGRIEFGNMANGILKTTEDSISYVESVSNNFWDEPIPDVPSPTDTFCEYHLGKNGKYYCFNVNTNEFSVLENGLWSTILKDLNNGHICPDGNSSNLCGGIEVSDYYVDEYSTLYFIDKFQIRFIAPSNEVYSIYGKEMDLPGIYGNANNLKSGRYVRLPYFIGNFARYDYFNQTITVEDYLSYEYLGNCNGCDQGGFASTNEGFKYFYTMTNGLIEIQKENSNDIPNEPVIVLNNVEGQTPPYQVKNRSVSFKITATDKNSNIEKICFKYNVDISVKPLSTDSCWQDLNDFDQKYYFNDNFGYGLGLIPGPYDVAAWSMDDDGNISNASNKVEIQYLPGKAPDVFSVLATNRNIPSATPPKFTDYIVNKDNPTLFIKWIASDPIEDPACVENCETISNLNVNIYYSLDNINFTTIRNNLKPDMSSVTCTTNSSNEIIKNFERSHWTGCFQWTVPQSLYNQTMFIRVEVIDNDSLGASGMAPPLNAGNMSILAGDIDKGVAGQARSALFNFPSNEYSDRGIYAFPNTFVVDSKGVTYFLDVIVGLYRINPADGIVEKVIGIDPSIIIPTISDGNSLISESSLKNPVSIFMDHQDNLLIYDFRYLRKINFQNNTIKTIVGGLSGTWYPSMPNDPHPNPWYAKHGNGYFLGDGRLTCGDNNDRPCVNTHQPSTFLFEEISSLTRPLVQANGRTIIPLPRGDILIDYAGFQYRNKQTANFNSKFDNNPYNGLWWYRPLDFNNLNGPWGVYPIKFSDGSNNECISNGYNVSYDQNGRLKNIFSRVALCDYVDQNSNVTSTKMLVFDASPLYPNGNDIIASIPAVGETGSDWPILGVSKVILHSDQTLDFGNFNYAAGHTSMGGVPYFSNRSNGKLIKIESHPDGTLYTTHVLGNDQGANCVEGVEATSINCNLELLDVFVDGSENVYFWDLSQIKTIVNGKVKIVFGRTAYHGDGLLSTSAKFSYISSFGLFGRNNDNTPSYKDLMILDVFSKKYKSVINGKLDTHFGTGHYGAWFGLSTIEDPDIAGSETKIYFNWGDELGKQRKSFQIDADGNIYFPIRKVNNIYFSFFGNLKISFDDFYFEGGPRYVSPISHLQLNPSGLRKKYNEYQVGDILDGPLNNTGGVNGSLPHVYGVNQDNGELMIHFYEKENTMATLMLLDLNDTGEAGPALAGNEVLLLRNKTFSVPKISDILLRYDNSPTQFCNDNDNKIPFNANNCKILTNEGWEGIDYKAYKDKNGKTQWATVENLAGYNARVFSIYREQDNDSEVFGKVRQIKKINIGKYIQSFDIGLINNEEILVYCAGGEIYFENLTTTENYKIPFKISDFQCTKAGLEIVLDKNTSRYSIVTSAEYRGIHSIVEIALPTPPKVTQVKMVDSVNGINEVQDRDFEIKVSGRDPNEPLKAICLKYNDHSQPKADDNCWQNINLNNTSTISDFIVNGQLGKIPGNYKVYIWLKDLYDEISQISNQNLGEEGVDVVTIIYAPADQPIIERFYVTTSTKATTMNYGNTRDNDRYYINWKLKDDFANGEIDLDVTFNGIDFIPVVRGLRTLNDGCVDSVSGCYYWLGVQNFIQKYVPSYLKDSPFKIKLKLTSNNGLVYSAMSSPLRANGINLIGENFNGYYSNWEDFSYPNIYAMKGNIHWNRVINQQFVVTRRGDIIVNHPTDGIIRLNISTAQTEVLVPRRHNPNNGDLGNNGKWADAWVDEVAKIAIDHEDQLYIYSKEEIRKAEISNSNGLIKTFETLPNNPVTDLFSKEINDSPFYFAPNSSFYHSNPNTFGQSIENFILETNLPGSAEKIMMNFFDYENDVEAKVRNLATGGTCGGAGETSSVDLSTCNIYNYFGFEDTKGVLSDFYLIGTCMCNTGEKTIPIPSMLHVGFNYTVLGEDTETTADDEIVLNFVNDIDTTAKFFFGNDINYTEIFNSKFFNGLDGELYFIHRGITSEDDFSIPSSDAVNAGIWKFNRSTQGWNRILGKQNTMGSCSPGAEAINCASSPRDMFVTFDGTIYFVEDNIIKRINEKGMVEFVTGKEQLQSMGVGRYVIRGNYFAKFKQFNGNFVANDPLKKTAYQIGANDQVSLSPMVDFNYFKASDTFICHEGKVCELNKGVCSGAYVFPSETDYLFSPDNTKMVGDIKTPGNNKNMYLNDWKCIGTIYSSDKGEIYVPYYQNGSSGVFNLILP